MTLRHIKTVLADVMAGVEKRAAAAHSAAEIGAPDRAPHGFGGSGACVLPEGGSAHARLNGYEGKPRATGDENAGAREAPASATGSVKPEVEAARQSRETRTRLAVVVTTGMRRVNRPNGFPRPALRSPVLIVVGGRDHAASRAG